MDGVQIYRSDPRFAEVLCARQKNAILTVRTIHAAPAAYFNLLQRATAAFTGLSLAPIYKQIVLIIPYLPLCVLIITERGSMVPQPLRNHLIDRFIQRSDFFTSQAGRGAGRTDAGCR